MVIGMASSTARILGKTESRARTAPSPQAGTGHTNSRWRTRLGASSTSPLWTSSERPVGSAESRSITGMSSPCPSGSRMGTSPFSLAIGTSGTIRSARLWNFNKEMPHMNYWIVAFRSLTRSFGWFRNWGKLLMKERILECQMVYLWMGRAHIDTIRHLFRMVSSTSLSMFIPVTSLAVNDSIFLWMWSIFWFCNLVLWFVELMLFVLIGNCH